MKHSRVSWIGILLRGTITPIGLLALIGLLGFPTPHAEGSLTSSPSNSSTLYLPLVARVTAGGGINGRVTQSAQPAAGVPLELLSYIGQNHSTVATTTTDGSGNYSFKGAPSLGSGQEYNVSYVNLESNTSRLAVWMTKDVTAYTAGSTFASGDFDLADIGMVSPSPGATVSLPATFQWSVRPATPSDRYTVFLTDANLNLVAMSSLVGYANSCTLYNLPSSMSVGAQYWWGVAVFSPDGGVGISYYFRTITFSNRGAGPVNGLTLSENAARIGRGFPLSWHNEDDLKK